MRTRSARSYRRKSCRRKKISGGAAIAAYIISDIKKSVEKAVDNSGLDDVMDSAASIDADTAKGDISKKELDADVKVEEKRAKEIVDALASDAYHKNREKLAGQVELILSGKVRDILPAIDVLAKEIDRVQKKELAELDAYAKKIIFSYFRRNLKKQRDAMIASHEKTDKWMETIRANIAKITKNLDPDEHIDFVKLDPENELSNLRASIGNVLMSLTGALYVLSLLYQLANEPDHSKTKDFSKGLVAIATDLIVITAARAAFGLRKDWLAIKKDDKYK